MIRDKLKCYFVNCSDRDDFNRGWGCHFIRTIAALAAQAERSQNSTHFSLATTI